MDKYYEREQNFFDWEKNGLLPSFNFKEKWNVKIRPPFGGAIIRFSIEYQNRWVSVYFDINCSLGLVRDPETDDPIPYFECFNGLNYFRYFLNEVDEMKKDIEEFLEGKEDCRWVLEGEY